MSSPACQVRLSRVRFGNHIREAPKSTSDILKQPSVGKISLLFAGIYHFGVNDMKKRNVLVGCLIASILLILNFQLVFAHETVTAGDYQLEIGWLTEPPITSQVNGIIVNVSKGEEEPVEDVSDLVVNVAYGGQVRALLLQPLNEDTPGQFVAPILPTIPGQYRVQLSGKLGDTVVSAEVELERVQAPEVIQFPIVEASSQSSSLGLTGWLALLGIVLGITAIVISMMALRKNH